MNGLKFLLILCLQFTLIKTARILAVIAYPSLSHQIVFRPFTIELSRRGHQVTVITTNPAFPNGQTPANFTEIDVHDVTSYNTWVKRFVKVSRVRNDDYVHQTNTGLKLANDIIYAQARSDKIREIISKQKGDFDLLLLELGCNLLLGYAHIFNVPVIYVSSYSSSVGLQSLDSIGIPSHSLIYPTVFNQRIYNLTFIDKLVLLYNEIRIKKNFEHTANSHKMLRDIFGQDTPSANELIKNVHMHIRNNHHLWIDNQPSPLNVVYIGGVHIPPRQELPKSLQSYMDSAQNGVIYMSLGTNVKFSLLPAETIQIFMEVFSKLPFKFLVKWDTDNLPAVSKNIRIAKWFPQSDLLQHPNMKLFITQGGLQSTDEAIHAGVPLIGIPVIADQFYNVEKYVQYKIGKRLDKNTLSKEQFEQAIHSVIRDTSYRENIKRLRGLMEDQPTTPLQRAVWWTEHVLRRDGEHFYAGEANVTWAQYVELELIIILLSLFFCGIGLFSFVTCFLLRSIIKKYYVRSKPKKIKI